MISDDRYDTMLKVSATGVSFPKSTARTTDVTEGGVQAIVIGLAAGLIGESSPVTTAQQLVELVCQLPATVMNHDSLMLLAAKLHNGDDDSKIEDAFNLAVKCYDMVKDEGFTHDEIVNNLRWMSKESTQGQDGTVGDVGIDLEDGRMVHVSLKACSTILHNGSPSQAMLVLNVQGYDPFADENVMAYDSIAFRAAWEFLQEKVSTGDDGECFKCGDKEWRIRSIGENQFLVYNSKKKSFLIPVEALTSLAVWKTLKQDEQKVLSYFVTANIKEIEAITDYKDAAIARQACISSNIIAHFHANDEATQRTFIAKMVGLRNRGALYLSSGNKGGAVYSGRIPTIQSFVDDATFIVGEPIVAHGGNSVKIPITNALNEKVMILNIRTRFVDGQFNYKGQRMTGEYVCSELDIAHFRCFPQFENSVFATVAEVIFGS